MSKILGKTGIILEDKQMSWTREGGQSWTFVYSGPESAALAQAGLLIGEADSINFNKRGNGPRFQVVARYGRDPTTGSGDSSNDVNTDELVSSEIRQSVLLSPVLRGLIPASVISVVVGQVTKVASGETTYSTATGVITAACLAAAIGNGNALELFDDLIQGRDSYSVSDYTYRRTYTVSRASQTRAAFADVNLILTTSQVRSSEGTPNAFPLPDGYWRKKSPHVLSALGVKTQITYEYEFGQDFNELYYEFA